MTDVISFKSRRPLAEQQRIEAEQMAAEERALDEATQAHRDNLLKILDDTRILVESGKLEGLIVLGRDPATGYFYNQIDLAMPGSTLHDLYPFLGFLNALCLEIADHSMMAPVMMADGRYVDPHEENEE